MQTTPKLVIGAGTGRCGTTSLAHLLNAQYSSHITHEHFRHKFKWNRPGPWVNKIWQAYREYDGHGLFGDVALQHGAALAFWLQKGAQVIVMKRDLEGYLASWHKKSGPRNNWQPPNQGGTPRANWYDCFPKFRGMKSKEAALVAYYDFYYDQVKDASTMFPDQVAVFHTYALNSEAGQRRILEFAGLEAEAHVYQVGIRRNKSKKRRR